VLAVDLDEFVVSRGGQQHRTRIRTLAQVAKLAGIQPGAPEQVYHPVTPLDPQAPLEIDRDAARLLADWYQLGAGALATFAAAVPGNAPTAAQLWPEHFDLAITAARVNYGVSPGDDQIAEPYLYISPFDGAPAGTDQFWNAPFGAALRYPEVISPNRAVNFFHAGRDRLGRAASSAARHTGPQSTSGNHRPSDA
jgi:hypothetical protein